jgi:error-prone DNA polymerase
MGGSRPASSPVPYAELHCHSSFSFLDGASSPEELVEEAARLELCALALTDHAGFYGVVRFAEAAASAGVPTVFGAELALGGAGSGEAPAPGRSRAGVRTGVPDPEGPHLVVLAKDPEGYARLARAISRAHFASGEKGRCACSLEDLAGAHGGHWFVLTGCRKGAVPAALLEAGPGEAARELARLVEAFGRDSVAVELFDHGEPLDSARNDALAELAVRAGVELVATTNVHYARPGGHRLASALAAVRARRSLDELDGYLPASGAAHLRSGAEQARRFARYPGAVERAGELGLALAFDLRLVAPGLPPFPVPPPYRDEAALLRALVEQGAERRYGPRGSERVPGAWAQLERELGVIERLGFCGYFLVVWEIVEFCRKEGIYCQGRGSAANSAVCYALGITNVDAVGLGLLFERFLSPAREGPPDIDLDIESGRREEVIQHVYARYGREHAAQVADVISYRPRSAVRDMARALGYPEGAVDAFARRIEPWGPLPERSSEAGLPEDVLALARAAEGLPRHLGLHSGGMVICDRPVVEVCPVEWARKAGRSVLQWDKDDCAAVGLVKFDLLGLGMLSALHGMVDLVREHHGVEVDLAALPQEDEVYEMLCGADSVGVFQVESRAQMATLPRLRPRCFYDLVVEVALIRPGPIQGGSVHPYLRRRCGEEAAEPLHPILRHALDKTLGIPLFQEQLMQMAIDAAGFDATEADRLRQAMGSKRSVQRMARLAARFFAGMAERGITGEVAEEIWAQMAAFANFGFPESHAVSFAYLVYASAWFKLHYPAAFYAALLNAQPMGFWSKDTLVADARRHGVEVRGPDVNASDVWARLEPPTASAAPSPLRGSPSPPPVAPSPVPAAPCPGPAVRLGLAQVRTVGKSLADRIVAERVRSGGRYETIEELARRTGAGQAQLEALAVAGALGGLQPGGAPGGPRPGGAPGAGRSPAPAEGRLSRRAALWAAGAVAGASAERLPGLVVGAVAPPLPPMGEAEVLEADLWATGIALGGSPMALVRPRLARLGVLTAAELEELEAGRRVLVGGVVTHRQRPATAKGTVFVNLEDETGLVNVICSPGVWARYRDVARFAPALLVHGRVERVGAAMNVVAERLAPLSGEDPAPLSGEDPAPLVGDRLVTRPLPAPGSRDFR